MRSEWSDDDEEPSGLSARGAPEPEQDDAADGFMDSLRPAELGEPPADDTPPIGLPAPLNGQARAGISAHVHDDPEGSAAAWPEPIDLSKGVFRGAALPLEFVPDCVRPLIADYTRRTGFDAGGYFLGFIAALSTLANDYIRLQPKQNDHTWTVRPVVWPFAVGGSSSGKTPALEAGMRFIQDKDTQAVTENAKKRKDHEFRLEQYADDCAVARKNKAPRPEEPEPPVLREFWVQRGTTEGVTRLLQDSPKVIWYMGEGSGLINGWDRYAAGGKGSGDREFVLMLWDGGAGKNTLAGKTMSIRNASAVLCGGSTPQAMRNACAGKLQADGFLQRTLLAMVPDEVAGQDSAPNDAAIAAYSVILDRMLDMSMPVTLKLSQDAQAIYNEFCDRVREIIRSSENESYTAHLGKWFGVAPRLMLIYHLAELASRNQMPADGQRVGAPIAHQVCRLLLDWQLTHIQEFWFELMADKAGKAFSRTVARYILANPTLQQLNFRTHISRPHWRAFEALKPWEIKDALNTLVNGAWLTPVGSRTNSYGLAMAYDVNPLLKDRFADWRAQEQDRRVSVRDELRRDP